MIGLNNNVSIIQTTFGKSLNFKKVIPEGTDVVVLLSNDGSGYRTIGVYMTHQIYIEKLEDIAKKTGAREFFIIPYDSKSVVKMGSV